MDKKKLTILALAGLAGVAQADKNLKGYNGTYIFYSSLTFQHS